MTRDERLAIAQTKAASAHFAHKQIVEWQKVYEQAKKESLSTFKALKEN